MTYASAVSSKSSAAPAMTIQHQPKTSFISQPKILFVGDSVANFTNLRKLEKSRKIRIRSAKAHSSVKDNNAKFPAKNFKDVVSENLKNPGREKYDVLVMSAPTVEKTNLDPSQLTTIDDKVAQSSKNMINIAEEALAENEVKQVVMMEHPPRFDGLKSQLGETAKKALRQFQKSSIYKDNIVIGQHSLESPGVGHTHTARYQDYFTGRYDGVHLYGPTGARDYTDSVDSMLLMAMSMPDTRAEVNNMEGDHTDCEQTRYQRRQTIKLANRQTEHRYDQHSSKAPFFTHPVPTRNRFSLLSQGNF